MANHNSAVTHPVNQYHQFPPKFVTPSVSLHSPSLPLNVAWVCRICCRREHLVQLVSRRFATSPKWHLN